MLTLIGIYNEQNTDTKKNETKTIIKNEKYGKNNRY